MANRLALEKSPYLLQHKDNPVDWRPWGEEAFAEARRRDVPLLLSIGYSTCHWCHVMEHESFSDPEVAAAMNARFVCVKLDREERPDVDKVYMTAVQAMTGQGGWPLNVFLTPELKPFFGGTYFPPTARWGQPGWIQLLGRVAELWKERRKDIESDAARLSEAVRGHLSAQAEAARKPAADLLARAEEAFKGSFDPEHAGFGGAPKFPMPAYQRFLLRRAARTGGPEPTRLAVESLRAMCRGGLFDQVGGGFHRYSTDAEWRVPHFEKMLYDNAQLLENLADAVLATRDAELERALRRTADYLERDLRGPRGGFYSAEDADSEGEEGAFYRWTGAEVEAALGAAAPAFVARYGVSDESEGGPYEADPAAMDEAAAEAALGVLLARRAERPRPSRDDKCLASWNGLALSGLSRAFAATGDERCLSLARGAADFLRRELASADGRTLWHRWRDGDRAVAGMSDDYAFVAQGLLDLFEAGGDPAHLAWAADLAEEAVARFAAPEGGVFQTAEGEGRELFARAVEDHDGVEPSASAALAEAALRLHELTGREGLRRFADATLARFAERMDERPLSMAYLLGVLDRALGTPRTLVVAGTDLPGGAELLAAARARLRPDLTVAGFVRKDKAALAALMPAVSAMPDAPRAAAFLCVGRACGLPTEDPAELARRLDAR
ncbi:MAG: thioredoxin domain-containing protein [Elusimicrobia bacterium]|nr:thioredoxin domain-containing protein [Elusimicrobiota bacterium]